jgi:hypothetical protein
MRAILEETSGVTHRIVQRLNAAAIVAIHEKIERITLDLLPVKRLEPARVIAAKRAGTIASVLEADRYRAAAKHGLRQGAESIPTK